MTTNESTVVSRELVVHPTATRIKKEAKEFLKDRAAIDVYPVPVPVLWAACGIDPNRNPDDRKWKAVVNNSAIAAGWVVCRVKCADGEKRKGWWPRSIAEAYCRQNGRKLPTK